MSNNYGLSEEELKPYNVMEVEANMLYDDSDTWASSELDSETDETYIQKDYITSRDGTKWWKIPHKSKGRTMKSSMLRQAPGLTRYTQQLNAPLNAFQLLFSDNMYIQSNN